MDVLFMNILNAIFTALRFRIPCDNLSLAKKKKKKKEREHKRKTERERKINGLQGCK